MTDGVFSDIVTISVLILINIYDKADPPTSKAGSTGPNVYHQPAMEILVLSLQSVGQAAYGFLCSAISETGTVCSLYRPRPRERHVWPAESLLA